MQELTSQIDHTSDYNQNKNRGDDMKIDVTKNTIVCGDNLDWLNDIADESIDLCYIDPPFFSNAKYEKVWGNGWEVASFGDRFAGGIIHYIDWMRPRIELIHKKLKQTGSIFLHCDWHASHRLRCLLDEVFGDNHFVNEIVWCYSVGGKSKRSFAQKHDNIYFYSKSKDYYFDGKACGLERNTGKKSFGGRIGNDENGRPYQDKLAKSGKIYRYYLDEGKIPEDWWTDINSLQSQSSERIGYVTQKPEDLIKRIVLSASQENDIVLDCFSGGFTTAKVCADTNRKFICGDVSPVACKVGAKRLNKAEFAEYEIKNMPQTEKELREMDGHLFAETICDLMGWRCNSIKSNDKGIDGWDGNENPVQIKNHKAKTGEKDLRNFWGSLQAAKKFTGIFVAWDFTPEGVEFVAKHKKEVNIELRQCRELVEDILIPNEKRQQIEDFYNQKVPEDWKEFPIPNDADLSFSAVG